MESIWRRHKEGWVWGNDAVQYHFYEVDVMLPQGYANVVGNIMFGAGVDVVVL